jgi:hypothetical protein
MPKRSLTKPAKKRSHSGVQMKKKNKKKHSLRRQSLAGAEPTARKADVSPEAAAGESFLGRTARASFRHTVKAVLEFSDGVAGKLVFLARFSKSPV